MGGRALKTTIGDRRVIVAMSFVTPDDEFLTMASDPEVLIEAKRSSPDGGELTQDLVDRVTGVKVTPVAHITILSPDEAAEAVVSMSKDELAKHIVACRAVFESMSQAAEVADRRWARYRKRKAEEAHNDDATH